MYKKLTIRDRINKSKGSLTVFTLGIIILTTILFKIWSTFGGPPITACIAPNMMALFMGIVEPYISSKYSKKITLILSCSYIVLTEILIILAYIFK